MVSITRRAVLLNGGLATAAMAVGRPLIEDAALAGQARCNSASLHAASLKIDTVPIRPALNVSTLTPFVDALPIPPLARSEGRSADPEQAGRTLPVYRIRMSEVYAQVHRDLQPTRFWAYNGSVPGPTILAQRDQGMLVEWTNALPGSHFLPIDHRLHGAGPNQPQVRTVVHVHGARARHDSDGYPDNWYTPGRSASCHYPNHQDAATLWYHDHAMGINRLNMYAGLVGAYLIGDQHESTLNLPSGEFDIPLMFCDRMFYRDDHQLYYPVSRYIGAPWVADLHADGTLINGKLFPYLEVQPRRYRLRLINAANNRGFDLSIAGRLPLLQIASDQGLLAAPVSRQRIVLAPAERAEVVFDFSAYAGQNVLLNSGAQGVLQFRVARGRVSDPSSVPQVLRQLPRMAAATAVKTRRMTLSEHDDRAGDPVAMMLNETPWHAAVTETPTLDSTEIWEFLNLTDDVHPLHLHLVRFQLLNRQNFRAAEYVRSGTIIFNGPPAEPEPAEAGWKDTIQVYPGSITRIIVRFEGYTGRYLWHCHVLEHEANEMMRPFEVLNAATAI